MQLYSFFFCDMNTRGLGSWSNVSENTAVVDVQCGDGYTEETFMKKLEENPEGGDFFRHEGGNLAMLAAPEEQKVLRRSPIEDPLSEIGIRRGYYCHYSVWRLFSSC